MFNESQWLQDPPENNTNFTTIVDSNHTYTPVSESTTELANLLFLAMGLCIAIYIGVRQASVYRQHKLAMEYNTLHQEKTFIQESTEHQTQDDRRHC